jgi:leucyl aminopeptidase
MNIDFSFCKTLQDDADVIIIPVYENRETGKVPEQYRDFIAGALETDSNFSGKQGQNSIVSFYESGRFKHIALAGFGKKDEVVCKSCEKTGGSLFTALQQFNVSRPFFIIDDGFSEEKTNAASIAAHFCIGFKLRSYKFDKYKNSEDSNDYKNRADINKMSVVGEYAGQAERLFARLDASARGTFFARDLTSEPANKLSPSIFARRLKEELRPLGVIVDIFDEKKLEKLGMEAFLAVSKGSESPPRMVTMRWKGTAGKKIKPVPLALVGKGITFDTGGISLKPPKDMDLMKMDMGGAAAIAGLMKALALRKSASDVVGIVGLAENMPDGRSYRPSDVLGSMSGKNIEIINTDAEGRLVLADCLTYVQRTWNPETLIDLATLTGSMISALGFDYCGTFVNDDDLWSNLEKAGSRTGEKLWRMPLDEQWRTEVVSTVADLRNIGTMGSYAGACTAAGFLENFIEGNARWAHLDLAGVAWTRSDRPTIPKGASGFGVRVLDSFIEGNYEEKP